MTAVPIDDIVDATLTTRHAADSFRLRWQRYSPEMIESLRVVYGEQTGALVHSLLEAMLQAELARSRELQVLDEQRLLNADWLQRPDVVGYVTYCDRFAGTVNGLVGKVDYLQGLGVKYLHLMPMLKPRPGDSDGGYAVQDYRTLRDDLGTMEDLRALTATLRERGISLVMDLVLNHVAQEHEWAVRARAGEQKYRDYFMIFPDRSEPDEYEQTLPEVFPDFAPGNFTWNDEVQGWVWTTFNAFQWDVNWANPEVFREYLEVIFFLANAGVEVIRLDAIAFIWKVKGTDCQNEPPVHHLTRALRAAARIVAPAIAFKAEAIVGPADLIHYLGTGQHYGKVSDLAYHNSMMVQLWSALAARDTTIFKIALNRFAAKPPTSTWGAYARCHDDIGWAISDEDAASALNNGFDHRFFLSDFYAGVHPGSFAKGLVFQENPVTRDRRISGTLASLAGLEQALDLHDQNRVDDAIKRILLLHSVMMGWGGVPLLYMGDELGTLNDYSFADDPDHAADNRWVHRPMMNWALAQQAQDDPSSPAGRVLAGIKHLVEVRASTPHLHASIESQVVWTPDNRLLITRRDHPLGVMLQVYNFSEAEVRVSLEHLRYHLGPSSLELLTGYDYDLSRHTMTIGGYEALWFIESMAV